MQVQLLDLKQKLTRGSFWLFYKPGEGLSVTQYKQVVWKKAEVPLYELDFVLWKIIHW